MTPRALVTAIGATAIAFAIAIGVAAGGTFDAAPATTPAAMAAAADVTTHDAASARLAAGNAPCPVAL